MARRTRRSGSASAVRRRAGEARRTGVDEREGWEDFAQKREWFLSGRAIRTDEPAPGPGPGQGRGGGGGWGALRPEGRVFPAGGRCPDGRSRTRARLDAIAQHVG